MATSRIGAFFGRVRARFNGGKAAVAAYDAMQADKKPAGNGKKRDEAARKLEQSGKALLEAESSGLRRGVGIDFNTEKHTQMGDYPENRANELLSGGHAGRDLQQNEQIAKDTYQIGWGSAAFFRKGEDGLFHGLAAIDLDKNVVTNGFDERTSFSQVVTRGVQSCTAAVVSKGDMYCFMHLDADTIRKHGNVLTDQIKEMFEDPRLAGRQERLCVSAIPAETKEKETRDAKTGHVLSRKTVGANEEAQFAAELINIAFETDTSRNKPKPIVQILDRGDIQQDFNIPGTKNPKASHMEFGLTSQDVIFGDKTEVRSNPDGKTVTAFMGESNTPVEVGKIDAITRPFAFGLNASQSEVDLQWKHGVSHTVTAEDGKERQCGDPEAVARAAAHKAAYEARHAEIDAHIQRLNETPTPYMQQSQAYVTGVENDRDKLGKALFGDAFVANGIAENTPYVRATRSGISIGVAGLFVQGHNFADIMNPDKLKDEKAAMGHMVQDWVRQGNSPDPAEQESSKRSIALLYKNFAEQYERLDRLPIDHANTADLAANYRDIHCRGHVAFDVSQEIALSKDLTIAEIGKDEYDRMTDTFAFNSCAYDILEQSVSGYKMIDNGKEDKLSADAALGVMAGIHMRGEVGAMINGAPQVKDFDGKQAYIRKADITMMLPAIGAADGVLPDEPIDNICQSITSIFEGRDVLTGEGGDMALDYNKGLTPAEPEAAGPEAAESFNIAQIEREDREAAGKKERDIDNTALEPSITAAKDIVL